MDKLLDFLINYQSFINVDNYAILLYGLTEYARIFI